MSYRFLLTSPEGYARRLMDAFREGTSPADFHPVSRPMIQTELDTSTSDFQDFIHHLSDYDYVAFSSRKAIASFALGLEQSGRKLPLSLRLCAIGKDNELIGELLHTVPAFLSEEPSPMGIVRHLSGLPDILGKRIAVLAPQVIGMEEPSVVPDFLRGLSDIGMQSRRITAYRTMAASETVLRETVQAIRNGAYDAVVFTSGTEIKVFLQMVPEGTAVTDFLRPLTVICYGPYTARCAADLGVPVDFTSPAFGSFQDLVEQIRIYYSHHSQHT